LQSVDETKINIAHFDRRTQFDDIYKVPINPWSEEAKARKSDEVLNVLVKLFYMHLNKIISLCLQVRYSSSGPM
jgi:hypothetical protein